MPEKRLVSFWCFSITAGSLPLDYWPLSSRSHAPRPTPHAPRRHPLGPAGSGRAKLSPAGYCLPPTAQLPKTERARSRRAALLLFQYVTEPGDFYGQNNLFLFTRRHSSLDRSLVAKALNPSLFRRACRMAISRNSCSLLDFPEFAQAVKYGVLASGKLWEGGRDLNSENLSLKPCGYESRLAKLDQQPEASLAWW